MPRKPIRKPNPWVKIIPYAVPPVILCGPSGIAACVRNGCDSPSRNLVHTTVSVVKEMQD